MFPRRSSVWFDPRVKPPAGAARLDRDHALARDLRAAWPVNERGGTRLLDSTERIPAGVLEQGPVWVGGGPFDVALRFDGTNDRVHVPHQALLNTTMTNVGDGVTLEVVCRVPDYTKFNVIAKQPAAGLAKPYTFIPVNQVNGFQRVLWGDGGTQVDYVGTVAVPQNQWVRLVTVSQRTSASNVNVTFYRDGAVTSGPHTGNPTVGGGTDDFYIGSRAALDIFANWDLALLRLWARALSAAEVRALSALPFDMYAPVLSPRAIRFALTRDAGFPVELRGLADVFRDAGVPVELRGLADLLRDAGLPVELAGAVARDAGLPVEWAGTMVREVGVPLAFTGIDPNLLLHRWLVLVKANAPLLHAWSVHALARTHALRHQWTVKEPLPSLPHRWNVTGDVLTPFGASPDTGEPLPAVGGAAAPGDVQQPVATKDKTP